MFKLFGRNCTFKIKMDLNKIVANRNAVFTLRWCSTPSSDNLAEWSKIKTKFTDKQLTQVLNILNKCNIKEMKKYGISEYDIEVLERLPTDNKVHQSLEDFLVYDTIKVTQLENICSTILLPKKATTSKKKSVVSRPIKKEILKNLKTAVGLRIGANYISWSQLELTGSNCNILKWDCQSISDLPLNVNLTELIKVGIDIAKQIPYADVYVMEKESFKPKSHINSSLLQILFRQQQLTSTIISSLFLRNELDGSIIDRSKTFFTMRPSATAQLFGLFVGQETVSAEKVVQALLNQNDVGLNNIKSVTINCEVPKMHTADEIVKKEEMNKALLLTLAFFESAILS